MAKVISGFVGLSTAVMMMGPAVASAATVEELTAQINALLAQVSALQAAQTTSAPVTSTAGYVFSVDLTLGSKGADVTALQQILVSKGHLVMPAGVAMGYFGNLTKSAVAAWQASAGIAPAAGYFGPKSRAAMNAMSPVATTPTTPTTPGSTPVVSGTGVSVVVDSASAMSKTLIQGQGVATLGGFKISNGGATAAKVTMLKFKRTGISSDSTVNNVYLYDSMGNRLTDSASIATGMINFSDSAGLVTVPAMGSVVVLVRGDLASASIVGQTVGVMLTDATADAGVVTGVPVSGPEHNIATAPSGMSTAAFTGVTPVDNTGLEPQNDFTVWSSSLNVGSRDTLLSAIRFQQIGSAYIDDVQNFRLMVDGVAVGSAVMKADANRFVSFMFATPVVVKAGTHTVKLVADIVGGSSRTFKYSLRRVVDVELWDSQLNVVVTPTVAGTDGDAVTMTNFPMNAGDVTVTAGTLTITKATDSPSGNVVKGGSGITLAKFKVKAQGEKVKVENLLVTLAATNEGTTVGSNVGSVRNGALFLDGVQIGSTANLTHLSAGTQVNLGSAMTLDAGKEYTLEVRGDVFDGDGTDNVAAGDAWTISLVAGSSNVYRMGSLGYFGNAAVSGNQVTVATGALTLAKYSAYANQTVTLPKTAFKIGEFRLTGGNTEGINIDTINVDLDTSSTTESFLQDVYVVYGSKTSQIKAVGAADLSFSVNEALAANGTMDIKVYANVPTTLGAADTVVVRLTVSGTSQNSGSAVSSTADVTGQTISVGSGVLTQAIDGSTPITSNVVANSMPKVASFKYTASNDTFTVIDMGLTVGSTDNAAGISELVFKDGATELKRVAMNGAVATATGMSVVVPQNETKVIDVYANLGGVGTGFATTSNNVAVTLVSTKYADTNGVQAYKNTVVSGNAIYAFKTKPTITNVALPTTVLTSGSQTVAKFTITSDAGGSIAWRSLTLDVASSTPSGSFQVQGYGIYEASSDTLVANITSNGSLTPAGGSTVVFASSGTNEEVVAGSRTYVVKATVTGSPVTGSSLSHKISVDTGVTARTAPNAAAAVTSGANFVWSDMSIIGHSNLTADWMDEYLVKNIPTDSQTLTK